MSGRFRAGWRWGAVAAATAALVSLPFAVAAWPVSDQDRSAAELRNAAVNSADLSFSGYAESAGGLELPVTDQLSSVADLFSDRTRMRVWWRGPTDNRVDVVTVGGETDVHTDTTGSWQWSYEDNRAVRAVPSPLALPVAPDLLPPTLARRVLSEADPGELSRIGGQRIAGRNALGLRVTPAAAAASVASVDIWIDASSGLPLQVQLVGKGADRPALDTRFLDVDLSAPSAADAAFVPPRTARVRQGDASDVLGNAGRQLPTIELPATLAGLPRRSVDGAPEALGLYGRGVTLLAVVPLSGRIAGDLRRAAEANPTTVRDDLGSRLTAGPLSLLVPASAGRTSYLLVGTVTVEALAQAAAELPTGAR